MASNILTKINEVCAKSALLPIKKLSDMSFGEIHKISKVYRVNTKYGIKIIADSETFSCFLPGRLNNMSDGDIGQLNQVESLHMQYNGRDEFQAHIIEFKSTPQQDNFLYYTVSG